jgi:Fe-S-cluster containining protein
LGPDDRCTIYGSRPLGCRIFPFDPTYNKQGTLVRLKLIQATECLYELDGDNDASAVQKLHGRHDSATTRYHARVATWNQEQLRRARQGRLLQTARDFLAFLGVS